MKYSCNVIWGNTQSLFEIDADLNTSSGAHGVFTSALKEFFNKRSINISSYTFDKVFELDDGSVMSNPTDMKKVVNMWTGPCSYIMSGRYDNRELPEYSVDDKPLTVICTPIGYRIAMGTGYNFMGIEMPLYFQKFTSKNMKRSSANSAKCFKTLKDMYKFILKNEEKFRYVCSNSNIKLEIDYTGGLPSDYNSKDLEDLIESINHEGDWRTADEEEEILEGEATLKEMEEEAERRLYSLIGYKPVLRDFPERLWKSEGPGILYYLNQGDDEVDNAVKEVRDDGSYPYHAVVSDTRIGRMISVLAVSKYKEDWPYERADKDGYLSCQVFNGPDIRDFGSIQVKKVNGGLMRTA